jgi:hypothetical protein
MFISPEASERLAVTCKASRSCGRLACFQARVEASAGALPVFRHIDACASHIAEAVQDLKAWARDLSVRGLLKVLAIDPYAYARRAARGGGPAELNFAFYAVPVGQPAPRDPALAGVGGEHA